MNNLIAAILGTVGGFLAAFFTTYFFPDRFSTMATQALIGAVVGGVIGGILGSMTGGELSKSSDIAGVRMFIGIGFGLFFGILGGTKLLIIDATLNYIRQAMR